MVSDLRAGVGGGLPNKAWRTPSPNLGPQAQGHIEQRRTGFSPTAGKQNGETYPPGPLLTPSLPPTP